MGIEKKNSLISEESLGYQNPTGREKGEDEDWGRGPSHLRDLRHYKSHWKELLGLDKTIQKLMVRKIYKEKQKLHHLQWGLSKKLKKVTKAFL